MTRLSKKSPKHLAAWLLAALMCGIGQSVLAHTTFRHSVNEGQRLFTALVIPHGCSSAEVANPNPIRGMSVVFPNGLNGAIVTRLDTNEPIDDISTVVEDGIPGAGLVDLSPALIQDRNIFNRQRESTDGDGNVRGFYGWRGFLQQDLTGVVRLRIAAPTINPQSCVNALKVRVAIANYCTQSSSVDDDDRADIWVGRLTPLYNDPDVVSEDFWPTLTVNRTSALDEACNGGYEVAVEPTDDDIDTFLPIKIFWPANAN